MNDWVVKLEVFVIAGTAGFIVGDVLLILSGKSWLLPTLATVANIYVTLNYNRTFDELARKWGWRK
jgi:hypothetical protein